MIIQQKHIRHYKIVGYRWLHFWETISNAIYIFISGLFATKNCKCSFAQGAVSNKMWKQQGKS